jgi:hypothetical protein
MEELAPTSVKASPLSFQLCPFLRRRAEFFVFLITGRLLLFVTPGNGDFFARNKAQKQKDEPQNSKGYSVI